MTSTIFDLTQTVSQIIEVERAQLDQRIQANRDRKESITDLNRIKSELRAVQDSLDTLQDVDTFQTKTATVADTDIVSAKSTVGAAELVLEVTVTTLAQEASATGDAVLFSGANADYQGTKTSIASGDINAQGGQDIDPNETIASGNINLDSGKSLAAGSFVINDATITVTTSDTVNTILTKINNSSADVTASYDADTDTITLEYNEIGDETITLESDTTGFFDAMRLDDGNETTTTGVDPDYLRDLDETNLSVSEGYFTINNHTIYVDPTSDSLNDVITRINNSGAGVSIFYNEEADTVTMTSKTEGDDIVLENDTSSFLDEIHILDTASDTDATVGQSTYEGSGAVVSINGDAFTPEGNSLTIHGTTINFLATGTTTVSVEPDQDKIVDSVNNFITKYNKATTTIESIIKRSTSLKNTFTRTLISMRNLVASSITNNGTYSYLADVGITFNPRTGAGGTIKMDEASFRENLDADRDSVAELFSFDDDEDGLRDDGGLANTLDDYLKDYTKGTLGLIDERKEFLQSTVDRLNVQIQNREDYFTRRAATLTDQFIRTQRVLQRLQEQFSKAQSIQINFSLVQGTAIR